VDPQQVLFDAEFFGVPIKHKLLTRDQRNVQQAPRGFDSLAWDAVDEGVTFERRAPHGPPHDVNIGSPRTVTSR
jgi:hypothetical protein